MTIALRIQARNVRHASLLFLAEARLRTTTQKLRLRRRSTHLGPNAGDTCKANGLRRGCLGSRRSTETRNSFLPTVIANEKEAKGRAIEKISAGNDPGATEKSGGDMEASLPWYSS
ncbi:hypothetical protein JCM16303_006847 [Sporobolomyces ruberrimus]